MLCHHCIAASDVMSCVQRSMGVPPPLGPLFLPDVTDHGETLVYAVSSRGNGERMLFAAANQAAAAAELADFLNDAAREFGYQPASCG
jgi:hypothetical protein